MNPHAPNDMEARAVSGWIAILFFCALLAFGLSFALAGLHERSALGIGPGVGLLAAGLFCVRGFFTLQPCRGCSAAWPWRRRSPKSWPGCRCRSM